MGTRTNTEEAASAVQRALLQCVGPGAAEQLALAQARLAWLEAVDDAGLAPEGMWSRVSSRDGRPEPTFIYRKQGRTQDMKNRLTSLGQGLLAAALLAGLACEGTDFERSEAEIQLGVAFEELGVEVQDCTQALVDTDFIALTNMLNLVVPTGSDAVISVVAPSPSAAC